MPAILKTGYEVARVQPVDMFPHTEHVETVMSFRPTGSQPARACSSLRAGDNVSRA